MNWYKFSEKHPDMAINRKQRNMFDALQRYTFIMGDDFRKLERKFDRERD